MKKIVSFILALGLACFGEINERDNDELFNPNLVVQKDGVCTIVCEKCAIDIYFTFDTEEYKKGFENEDDAYTMLEDLVSYWFQIAEYLRGYKIPISATIYENTCPTLKFGDIEMAFPQSRATYILYKKGKKPYIIKDITSPYDEINAYFGIKDSQTSQPKNKEKK